MCIVWEMPPLQHQEVHCWQSIPLHCPALPCLRLACPDLPSPFLSYPFSPYGLPCAPTTDLQVWLLLLLLWGVAQRPPHTHAQRFLLLLCRHPFVAAEINLHSNCSSRPSRLGLLWRKGERKREGDCGGNGVGNASHVMAHTHSGSCMCHNKLHSSHSSQFTDPQLPGGREP